MKLKNRPRTITLYAGNVVKSSSSEIRFNVTKTELCLEGYCPECDEKDNRD